MKRALLPLMAAALLAACETTPAGPPMPPPPPPTPPPSADVFRPQDFSWSQVPGGNSVNGVMVLRIGGTRYTCANSTVVLTPETLWSRKRMITLYGSPNAASAPAAAVRARTPASPDGFSDFVRQARCDAQDRFAFTGLPDGAWFAITIARPAQGTGEPIAVMRRVETRGGRPVTVALGGA